ncbi:MAG: hypothetical protein HY812_09050 [Planctomycetes bacterium]|nr:hypothetical protein [Planctomycetota bacterium]
MARLVACTRVLLMLAVGALSGCSGEGRDPYEPYPPDSWERALPTGSGKGMERLADERFRVVPDAYQPEAQALLAAKSHALLSEDLASRYGLAAPTGPGAKGVAVLLRGLEAEKDGSKLGSPHGFSVYWKDGCVDVVHCADRMRFTPSRRRALIAVLPCLPKEVYTTADIVIFGGIKLPP